MSKRRYEFDWYNDLSEKIKNTIAGAWIQAGIDGTISPWEYIYGEVLDMVDVYLDDHEVHPADNADHPAHYQASGTGAGVGVECIDAMEMIWGRDAVKLFCELNAFKYLWRSKKKGGDNDIAKATWYLKHREGMTDEKQ